MKRSLLWLSALALLFTVGCAGGAVFTNVNLEGDLSPTDIERYQREMGNFAAAGGQASGQDGHQMMTLESKNWWPLGLLAYWEKGSVEMMCGLKEPHYMVSKSTGYGPLAMLFINTESATYDAAGKRESYMAGDTVLWGFVAKSHTMGSRLDNGHWMQHQNLEILMHFHLLNVGGKHGGMGFSLGSDPNPMSIGE